MAIQQLTLFEQVFSDAHLVDIDMSAWDKRIGLCVLADHVGRTAAGRKRLFLVEFTGVQDIDIEFHHLSHDPPIDLPEDEHVQWRLHDFTLEPLETDVRITLWGLSASPRMAITCRDVTIRELPIDVPTRLFPGWMKPASGFIRPGLETMADVSGPTS